MHSANILALGKHPVSGSEVSILLEIRINLMAIILNDVRVTDGEMFFDFYEISIGYIFVFS